MKGIKHNKTYKTPLVGILLTSRDARERFDSVSVYHMATE